MPAGQLESWPLHLVRHFPASAHEVPHQSPAAGAGPGGVGGLGGGFGVGAGAGVGFTWTQSPISMSTVWPALFTLVHLSSTPCGSGQENAFFSLGFDSSSMFDCW